MAINLLTQYPGRVTASDANYLYGSAKNETVAGAGDGTPHELARSNDLIGLQQALLRLASIVPSGSAETQLASQYLQALVELASGRSTFYDESGIVNAYQLDAKANQQLPAGYFDGMLVEFYTTNANTLASTIKVGSLAVKNVFFKGIALAANTAGQISATELNKAVYDLANDRFNLLGNASSKAGYTPTEVFQIEDTNGFDTNSFAFSSIANNTTESVGPTGSGATNIWTALDIVPAAAKWIKVKTHVEIDLSSAAATYGQFWAQAEPTGTALDLSDNDMIASGYGEGTGAAVTFRNNAEVTILLGASNVIDVYRNFVSTGPTLDIAEMVLVGWGE